MGPKKGNISLKSSLFPYLCILFTIFGNNTEAASDNENPYEVLSLSAAIIDHLIFINDDQLAEIAEEKGSWSPIDYITLQKYLASANEKTKMSPGGSGVNVIKGLAHLGHHTAVIGKVGNDEMGDYYIEQLQKKGIVSLLQREPLPTGQALCFITPDGQRTFRSYLGASHSLTGLNLEPTLFENIRLFHVEGYQLVDSELVLRALKMAKKQGVKVSLDLANTEIVRRYRGFINQILREYIDILLCNQDEAKELTGLPPKEACSLIAKSCPIAVVTMSEKGCWTQSGKTQFLTPAYSVEPIDTTGAGDYFASGFLHGILTGAPLQTCALQGSLIASHVVTEVGTEIKTEAWCKIHLKLQNLCMAATR